MADQDIAGSEQRYRELFEDAPISLWEEDFSGVKAYLDRLSDAGVRDFDAYFRENPQAFVECARLVRLIDVNRHTLRLYGARSKQELYDNLGRTVPPEAHAFFRDQLTAIAEGRATFQGETVNLDLRGERLHLFLKWAVSTEGSGDYSRVLVTVVDETERVEVEDRLQAALAEWKGTFEAVQDLVFILDGGFRVVRVNAAAERFFGMRGDEMAGRQCYDLVHGSSEPVEGCPLAALEEGGGHREAELFLANHGIWAQISVDPVYDEDGRLTSIVHIVKDVTARKRAEEKLQESERLYRMLADNTQDLICMVDKGGARKYVSPSYRTVLGYEPEELLGGHITDIVHPDDLESTFGELRAGMGEGRLGTMRHRLLHKDGSIIWAESHGTPILDEEGELIGGLAVSWDVTDRVEAEERLKESERLYRMLADNTQDLICLCDTGFIRRYVSPSYQAVLGYDPEELLGEKLFNQLPPEDIEARENEFAMISQGWSPGTVRRRVRHKDGRTFWIDSSSTVLRDEDGKLTGWLVVSRDVTEKALAEEGLRQEREQLLSIFDSINQIIYVSDPATYEVLYVNKSLREAFGTDLVGGLCYREFQGLEEPCGFCTNLIILGNKDEPYVWEYHNPVTNRDYLLVDRIIGWPPDGRDARFELAVDITERKRAEEELRETNEQLKGFLSVAAHELRHPINLVQGYVGTLNDFREDSSPEMLEEIYSGIRRASNRLVRLVEELLEVSRIEQERFAFALEPARPRELVEEAVGELKVRGVGNAFEVRTEGMPETWPLDRDRFCQLMVILLENAVNYSPAGSPVEVELKVGEEGLAVSVLDRGRGVNEEDRELVFQRFYQVEDPRHHSVPGLGMGLYVAREIVERHGGEIRHEPRPGGGSAFRFTLPGAASPSRQ